MPPFVAKENLVTTLWTELGSLAAPLFLAGELAYLASSASYCSYCCCLETGLGTDSVLRSSEAGCDWFATPSPILGNGLAT